MCTSHYESRKFRVQQNRHGFKYLDTVIIEKQNDTQWMWVSGENLKQKKYTMKVIEKVYMIIVVEKYKENKIGYSVILWAMKLGH